ncbi:hypothetical protein [Chryseobacterium polytrichastri]|uniref:Beta-lactamase-inhibitor-like, PepSY-like n=1 Tax=Chryseobacterium polytrichastri TaxID=1302687 RepID=A0A1M7FTK2_9FLAO|nr:hypothetical protein [Chryseobacterium polytrichastri]SHM07363.1 hypothetical protein SAMN05444267_103340 [Chryseobacterium polytrichastri]
MRISLTLICFCLYQFLFSQADCIKPLVYSGEVNIKNFEIDKIYVPSTLFLSGTLKFNELGGFKTISFDSTSNIFIKKSGTNLSSHFCKDPNLIIEELFKQVKSYPIRIFEKKKGHITEYRILNFEIPTDEITFSVNDENAIVITFPEINNSNLKPQ